MSEYLETAIEAYDPPVDLTARRWNTEQFHYVMTDFGLKQLNKLSDQARNEIEEIRQSEELAPERGNYYILFHILAIVMQDEYIRRAFLTHFVDEECVTESVESWVNNGKTNAYMLLDLLNKAGIVDDGLKGEIKAARDERNTYAHAYEKWITWPWMEGFDNRLSQMDRVERSVVRLIEVAHEAELES